LAFGLNKNIFFVLRQRLMKNEEEMKRKAQEEEGLITLKY
jgi:hypothetical protein